MEAEYIALSEATREILWYRGLFQELQQPISVPTVLKGDNQGSIETAYNPKHHNRTKHTLLKFQFVREQIVAKTVTIDYIPTTRIAVDGLTKLLSKILFTRFIAMLRLVEYQTERRN